MRSRGDLVAIIATAERERNKRRFMHKKSGRILFKNVFKNVSKNARVISRSYAHGGEKIKQTVHAPVPAALELRRAVVAKVKAHYYSCARKRCGVVFSSSFEVMMICFFL